MSFPTDAGRAQTRISSSSGVHTINLPGSISAGDLLIWVIAWDGGPGAVTYISGWTHFDPFAIYGQVDGWVGANGGASYSTHALYRWADGSEGATVTANPTNNEASNSLIWRVTGADPDYRPRALVAAAGASTTPNPPDFEPGWGLVDVLWLAGMTADSGTATPSGSPTNYGNFFGGSGSPESGGVGVRGGSRQLQAISEDPGAYTNGTTSQCIGFTIAIKGIGDQAITNSPFDMDAVPTRPSNSSDPATVNLPPDLTVGDLLVIALTVDGLGGLPTVTTPTDWTLISSEGTGSGDEQVALYGFWREVDGSEADTISVDFSKAVGWTAVTKRIKGWNSTDAPEWADAEGASAAPDCPSLSPSWGSRPTLWLAAACINQGSQAQVTGVPTNFEKRVHARAVSGHTGGVGVSVTSRYEAASSQDPSAYASPSNEWVAATIAVLAGPSGRTRAKMRAHVV